MGLVRRWADYAGTDASGLHAVVHSVGQTPQKLPSNSCRTTSVQTTGRFSDGSDVTVNCALGVRARK